MEWEEWKKMIEVKREKGKKKLNEKSKKNGMKNKDWLRWRKKERKKLGRKEWKKMIEVKRKRKKEKRFEKKE